MSLKKSDIVSSPGASLMATASYYIIMGKRALSSPPAALTASLAAMIIGHVYFAVFIKKNWPDLKAMFTGTIPLEEYMRYHEIESE